MSMVSRYDWNIATLVELNKDSDLSFMTAFQRGNVWPHKKNDLLIHSILLGWPISIMYVNRRKDGKFEGLEGKQRNSVICDFANGVYRLSSKTPPVRDKNGNEIQIAYKTFDQLPEPLKAKFLGYGLVVYGFDDMTIDEKIEFFFTHK